MVKPRKQSADEVRAERDALTAILAHYDTDFNLDDAVDHLYTNRAGELVYMPPAQQAQSEANTEATEAAEGGSEAEGSEAADGATPATPATSTPPTLTPATPTPTPPRASTGDALRLLKGSKNAAAQAEPDMRAMGRDQFINHYNKQFPKAKLRANAEA